ncbi:hypothetical protein BAUCODRAFT_146013 [Baudoinia panamericana UAMH 10762]|uniref:Transcription factor CBF/NF-Y/archaeal histone domain-containing protein n=1 Tax=Baudoinia panamericana (strain UAMH 10762) TaxID=717646 RepID=M2MQH0_BAUPA|nr:uncharacterized protein BAUCODRAFT_146013 [Baudoinia panamericana UAMH 10762]EMC99026.1 hypothetical protein BAUCODRAFT_146013 [Baudoinia panamericana UAMH 10762]
MDSSYRPQSPDLSSYAPQSPDLSGLKPQTTEYTGIPIPQFGSAFGQHYPQDRFGGAFGGGGFGGPLGHAPPTSIPQQPEQYHIHHQQSGMAAAVGRRSKQSVMKEDEYMPDAPTSKRPRKGPTQSIKAEPQHQHQPTSSNPTRGVELRTSFPVARIKRIMQADEDVGKVAQVTPHVVSRALELFMIDLISASAEQARAAGGGGGGSKSGKKILVQHMKKAILEGETFRDWLQDTVNKVPDAPSKAKKEAGSDSEDAKPKKTRRGKAKE